MGSIEALKEYLESGGDNSAGAEAPHPRWIRINTIKSSLDKQFGTTFSGFEQVDDINKVRKRGVKCIYLDKHIPNLVAVPASLDLIKSPAYTSGALIFQDKASCFPAYLLDPQPTDGDVIDSCAAPGNKTTHAAAIMLANADAASEQKRRVFAFEKDKRRAEILNRMIGIAGSNAVTTVAGGQDFLKVDPKGAAYKHVGALLLDPSCSGSGIVGRDDMPELHLPELKAISVEANGRNRKRRKPTTEALDPKKGKESLKRKREEEGKSEELETLMDDDGVVTAVTSGQDLENRLAALSSFQLSLLLHAMTFPAAKKITYSTCSIHSEENESVVLQALASDVAKARGWRMLKREDQVKGMRDWPVRGVGENENGVEVEKEVSEACIRANKGDEHGTMGFFLAGFVRDGGTDGKFTIPPPLLFPKTEHKIVDTIPTPKPQSEDLNEEWSGFDDELPPKRKVDKPTTAKTVSKPKPQPQKEKTEAIVSKSAARPAHNGTRPNLLAGKPKKRKKS